MPDQRPVAITLGDAAGIGPEIIAKALHTPAQRVVAWFLATPASCSTRCIC